MNLKKLAFACILVPAGMAFAETTITTETTSTVKIPEGNNASDRKNIDEEITNAKLRAATGSKKLVSLASSFSYSGGALTNPTSTERPQLNEGQVSADPTKLNGQISVKYRMTDHDNLNVGLGIDYTPEYTKDRTTGAKEEAKWNASTPYVSYGRVFKAGEVQNVLSATLSKYTASPDVNEAKLNYNVYLDHTMMVGIGTSKAEIGLVSFIQQEFYSEEVADGSFERQIGFYPVAEYAVSDKLSLRTVSRWIAFNVSKGSDTGKLAAQTQSVGVGYAATRDVYLYPNMQWKWSTLAADQTTVGLSANINL